MSTKGEPLYHSVNGSVEETWVGFSWPAFFFGIIWLAIKGLWAHALVNFILLVITSGIAAPVIWIVYGFIGNDAHRKSLLKKGYLTREQSSSPGDVRPAAHGSAGERPPAPQRSRIEQIQDLAALREKGFLTEAEFTEQKTRLLAS